MLNLSDNELDRLSREAASQHDPGDPLGPQSWERLELRLDKELGRASPDMPRGLRSIRRFPFQYAPVLLLIVGVTYYFVKTKGRKESSGGPPLTVVKAPPSQPGTSAMSSDSSHNNSAYSDKSTTTLYPGGNAASGVPANPSGASASQGTSAPPLGSPAAGPSSSPSRNSGLTKASSLAKNSGLAKGSDMTKGSGLGNGSDMTKGSSLGNSSDLTKASDLAKSSGLAKGSGLANSRTASRHNHGLPHNFGRPHNTSSPGKGHRTSDGLALTSSRQSSSSSRQSSNSIANPEPPGLEYAFIQRPFSLRSHPRIDDSALRAYVAPAQQGPSLHIRRSLTLGIQLAPDFSSVNALAGDRPGSTIGLTAEYEVLHNWHLGTGLLFSRRNYTARGMDYHVPMDYYRQNNIKAVDFVKGTMNMLEIPLTLRYDFSVTGNTIFFASAGVSSYILGKENCNYYYDFFGREVCRSFKYSNTPNGLFTTANISLGVETGISNSLSLMVAPYMKLPTNDIGFGKVRMNSVGINFALHYSPVTSRTRQY